MLQTHNEIQEFKTVHFCGGIGGCSLGMQQSEYEYKGVVGRFKTLFSVDVDPGACEAYRVMTGSKAICRDMFDREQYILFHGAEPPVNWQAIQPEELREWADGEHPDVIFISAPCKGFSRLLPNAAAQKPKYKALNMLAVRAMSLAMEAWGDDPPAVIMFENVPGIETRGAHVLREIRTILGAFGYVFHEGHHDCGEIGNLGQRRIRYLMIARQPQKLESFIYQPPKLGHRTIGDVLGPLPMPGDTEHGGKMHRLPNLAWKTWERLALIPAGKDWRALKDLHHTPQNGTYRIVPWGVTANTVTAEATMPKNASSTSVADPRLTHPTWKRTSVGKVAAWDETTGAVIANPNISGSGTAAVQDPRISEKWSGAGNYKIMPWGKPSNAVTASGDIHAGAAAVADPRIPEPDERGVWIIIAEDGTWHRPITTFEMAMLQGCPAILDGRPFELPGNSDAKWREWIGNMVPVPTATAIGDALLTTMMPNYAGDWHWNIDGDEIWVRPGRGTARRIVNA